MAECPDSTEPNALEKKIIRQLEFYFGDRNLSRDKFLQDKIKEDENGWVLLEVLLTFNRLKALSTDCSLIAGAIRKSSSELLEVNEDGTKIRRQSTDLLPTIGLLSPETRKEIKSRTLHIKGFPQDTTLDDLEEFLLQYGETELINMRRIAGVEDGPKQFKGSIFVEFKSNEPVTKILQEPEFKYKENVLFVETKDDYYARQKSKKESTKSISTNKPQPPPPTEDKSQPEVKSKKKVVKQSGAILKFKGCGEDASRENIKEYFREYCSVAWIDFDKGDTEGHVRFSDEGGAKRALDGILATLNEGESPKLCDSETILTVLEGDEELEYWEKTAAEISKKKSQKHGSKGKGGYRGTKRVRSKTSSERNEGPSQKSAKNNQKDDED